MGDVKLIALLIATAAPSCGALTPPVETADNPDELVVTVETVCNEDGTWNAHITADPPTLGGTWHLISGYSIVTGWLPDSEPYTFIVGPYTAEQSAATTGLQWRLDTDPPESRFDTVTVDNPGCPISPA